MTNTDYWMTPPRRTAVSTLYGLEPKGLGTGQVQSAYDYLCSLAFAHRTTLTMVMKVTLSAADKSARQLCAREHDGMACHGTAALASSIVFGMQKVCGRGDVCCTTLTPLKEFIAGEALLHQERRFCPACFAATAPGRIPHGRLLWRVKAVEVCPIHGTRLITAECGAPAQQQLPREQRPVLEGVCPRCGSVGRRCCAIAASEGTKEQWWVAKQVEGLVARQTEIAAFGLAAFKRAFNEKYRKVPGELRALANRCEVNSALLYRFVNQPAARISLGNLLRIAATDGYELIDLMLGRFVRSHEGAPFQTAPRIRHKVPASWPEIAEKARSAAAQGMTKVEFVRTVGVHESSLRKHLPEHARALAQNTLRHRQSVRSKKHEEQVVEVERVATKALERQLPLTLRVASELTGTVWYPSYPKAQVLAAVRCALSGKTYEEKLPWSKGQRDRVNRLIERLQRVQSGALEVSEGQSCVARAGQLLEVQEMQG